MLEVEKLIKVYPSFKLDNVSFELQKGKIMGFIGMNGAGKTTTLKCILNLVQPDSGKVLILGKDMSDNEPEIKRNIGFMFGAVDYYEKTKIKKIVEVYRTFFAKDWDESSYKKYMQEFNLDENKKVSELSAGMKVKLGITFALSHNAKLIILDEPTSGLDPIARDEILDIFEAIIADGEKSILFSTHITSDLDKCADDIIFIKNGKLVANCSKAELLSKHILIEGDKASLTNDLKEKMIGFKTTASKFFGLLEKEKLNFKDKVFKQSEANLEDIMLYYNKGDMQ